MNEQQEFAWLIRWAKAQPFRWKWFYFTGRYANRITLRPTGVSSEECVAQLRFFQVWMHLN